VLIEEAGAEVVASLWAGHEVGQAEGPLVVVEVEERRLLEAARGVEARRKEVAGQRAAACGAVNGHFDAVVEAAERRRGELLASLESEADRKDLVLAGQQAALQGRAGRLGALRADVEQRAGGGAGRGVVALVESATRLREEARAIEARTQQQEEAGRRPVEVADLMAVVDEGLPDVVGRAGWAGALSVDPARSTLTLQGVETIPGGGVAAVLSLRLVDARGGPVRHGAGVDVQARPLALVQGPPRMEDEGDGTYRIVVPVVAAPQGGAIEGDLRLRVRAGGREVQGSPSVVFRANLVYFPRFEPQLHAPNFQVQADGREAANSDDTGKGLCLSPALPVGVTGPVYWKIAVRLVPGSAVHVILGISTREAVVQATWHQRGLHGFFMNGTLYSGGRRRGGRGMGPVFGGDPESVAVLKFERGQGRLSIRMQDQQQVFTMDGMAVVDGEEWHSCVVASGPVRFEVLRVEPEDCF
jgi:hypothetical protein